MAGQILVVVKKDDRLEQMIPYLEKIAKPGTKVVFLIPYQPNEGFGCIGAQGMEGGFVADSASTERDRLEDYSLEEQRRERKVFLAQQELRRKGVEIMVDVYTGRLRNAVKHYNRQGNVQLIMMRAGSGHPLMRLLYGMFSLLHWFKPSNLPPIILLNPGHRG